MIRFPNPGSNIDGVLVIFKKIFLQLDGTGNFNLDQISKILVQSNLASSSGYIGPQALELSTRSDRSRDPLFNQSKMYTEIFRHLGWINTSEKKLDFFFTDLGEDAFFTDENNSKKFLKQCLVGMSYPNVNINLKSNNILRPFPTILKTMHAMDNQISRDEMILGPLSIEDDRNKEKFLDMISYLSKIRKNELDIQNELKLKSEKTGISRTTLENYTRFPLAVLKWSGWTIKKKMGKRTFHTLTETGIDEILQPYYENDIRFDDIKNMNREKMKIFCHVAQNNIIKRADLNKEIKTYDKIKKFKSLFNENKLFKKLETNNFIFSPFQELDTKTLKDFFPKRNSQKIIKKYSNPILKQTPHDRSVSQTTILSEKNKIDSEKKRSNSHLQLKELVNCHPNNLPLVLDKFIEVYRTTDKTIFYPLVAELFSNLGFKCKLSRHGVNYERYDAMIVDPTNSIPIEIKSPSEEEYLSVKAIRQALENKVILMSRKNYFSQDRTTTLAVGFSYPNKRSDVHKLIDDIQKVFKINIGLIDFSTLVKMNLEVLLNTEVTYKNKFNKLCGCATTKFKL